MSKAGKHLTSEEAEKKLAAFVLGLIMGKGYVSFPQSTRGTPSPVVLVVSEGSQVYVKRDQWNLCVLPVLQDDTWSVLRTPKGRELTRGNGYLHWETLIGKALRKSFNARGY